MGTWSTFILGLHGSPIQVLISIAGITCFHQNFGGTKQSYALSRMVVLYHIVNTQN